MGAGRVRAAVLAAAVVAGTLLLVAGLVAFVVLDDGWTRVIWAVVGAFLLWQLVPRPERLSHRAVPVSAADAPGLHRLVDEVAAATGTRPPDAVAVDTLYATSLLPVGYLGRAILVVGLPQWTTLDDDERLAVLAHELVCTEPARSPTGILIRFADDLLTRWVAMLTPTAAVQPHEAAREQFDSGLGALGGGDDLAGARTRRDVAANVGAAGLTVVASPAKILQAALRGSALASSSRLCLHADGRAAALVGSPVVVGLLLSTLPVPRAWVAAEVAARRRVDPFAAMADAPRPVADELGRRLVAAGGSGERVGPTHAPTALRIEALRQPVVVTRVVGPDRVRAADRDLDVPRRRLAQRFAEELVHGRS